MFISQHFDSSTRRVAKLLGLTLRTLILTVRHSSCGRRLERGNSFFPSLRAEQRFTVSARLPPLGYIRANMWKMRRRMRGKRGRGKELDDVTRFIVTKKILSAGQTQKHCILFAKVSNDEQQLQKQRWQKEEGSPTNRGSAVATKNLPFCRQTEQRD